MSELSAARLTDLFGAIGERYRYATRMARDLRARVESLAGEREQWMQAFAEPTMAARARLELKEIDALHPRVERSAVDWAEKARALELLVGTCLLEASVHPFRRRRPDPDDDGPLYVGPIAPPQPALWPDDGPGASTPAGEGMSPDIPTERRDVCSDGSASPT